MKKGSSETIIIGFKTVILALCLYIFELLFLPVFGTLQRIQVSGQGFYSDFWKYAAKQPYPTIFLLTGIVLALGIVCMIAGFIAGYKEKR